MKERQDHVDERYKLEEPVNDKQAYFFMQRQINGGSTTVCCPGWERGSERCCAVSKMLTI